MFGPPASSRQNALRRPRPLGLGTLAIAGTMPAMAVVVGTVLYFWRTAAVDVPTLAPPVPVLRTSADAEPDAPPTFDAAAREPQPRPSPPAIRGTSHSPPPTATGGDPPSTAEMGPADPAPTDAQASGDEDDPLVTDFFGVEVRQSELQSEP